MGQTRMQRVRYDGLRPLPAGNVILSTSPTWGAGASVALALGSNDMRGRVQVTVGAGPGVTPTWTLTFLEPWDYRGALSVGPFVVVWREGAGTTPALDAIDVNGFTISQGGPLAGLIIYGYRVTG